MMNLAIALIILSPYTCFIPCLFILGMLYRRKLAFILSPLNVGLALLFICSLLSGLVNQSLRSVISSFVILFNLALVIYLESILAKDPAIINSIMVKVWTYSFIAAVLGIIEKIASYYFDLTWIADFYLNKPIEYIYRIYSTFGNPNVAGSWFAAMIIISLYLWESQRRQKKKYIVGILIFIIGLAFSGSKGATLSLEVAILVYALLTKNKVSKNALLVTFFIVLLCAAISPEINHPLSSRIPIWTKVIKLYFEKPILGWGTFGILAKTKKLHAHNLWLSLLTMYGTVGFLIYVWIKVYIWKNIQLLLKSDLPIFSALTALQVMFVAHGCVDFVMMTPQGGILFFAGTGMVTGLARYYEIYYQEKINGIGKPFSPVFSKEKDING